MGKRSKIEWTDATWNPWYGCSEVSAGCEHCYARAWAKRTGKPWKAVRAKSGTLRAPLHWSAGRKVFVCSLSDFWLATADAWRADAWKVIQQCPQHTFMLLTKRPDRIGVGLPPEGIPGNVWLGVTVEDQKTTWRIDELAKWPEASVRFLSCEPLLGPLNLFRWLVGAYSEVPLDWIIVGGESGAGCRPMSPYWAQSVVSQAQQVEVPVFLKQLGGHPDPRAGKAAKLDGVLFKEWPVPTTR